MEMSIVDLFHLPDKCILGLAQGANLQISYTASSFNFMINTLKQIKEGKHRYFKTSEGLTVWVMKNLDPYHGNDLGKYLLTAVVGNYLGKYNILNPPKPLVVNPKVIPETIGKLQYRASVYLILPRYQKLKVKEFLSIPDAEDYIKQNTVEELLRIASTKASY